MSSSIIACRPQSYGAYRAVAYSHLQSLGLRHVEIEVPPAEELTQVVTALNQHGLQASSLHGTCDVQAEGTGERVAAQMPAFEALGTAYFFASIQAGGMPLETVYGRLREAGEVAADHNVTIVLETHPDLLTNAEVALATMRGVRHSHVRINFDTANIYFYNQGVDAAAQLRRVVEFVGAVHLKDTDGGFRHWHFPALGRGIVPFPEIFRILDDASFAGPCTLEIEGIEGESKSERLVCDRIAESVGYLRGLGRL